MQHGRYRLVSLVAFSIWAFACTRTNPEFGGPSIHFDDLRPPSAIDLSVAEHDQGIVIAMGDLSKSVSSDLTVAGGKDLSTTHPGCGDPGQACCNGGACTGGGCCVDSVCVATGTQCDNDNVCSDGDCTSCGGAGDPCCADGSCSGLACCGDDRTCIATATDDCGDGLCVAGSCGGCGGNGQACCSTGDNDPRPDYCSASGLVCARTNQGQGNTNESCQACGGDGEPCCELNRCDDGGCCAQGVCRGDGKSCLMQAANALCKDGSCAAGTPQACGALGQGCCLGTLCTGSSTRCIDNSCQACGGQGQRCCFDYASQQNIGCGAPYAATIVNNTCFCQ